METRAVLRAKEFGTLNTWESIEAELNRIRECGDDTTRTALATGLLVHLRLLGQDEGIPDLRIRSGNIEEIYAGLERGTRNALDSVRNPSDRFIYYIREVLKKLPVRQDAESVIERIRAEAERFEESRGEDDPLRGFAADLRKEVHRRLSPRILGIYLDPYLALIDLKDPGPMAKAGYIAAAAKFNPEDEDPDLIQLARDLRETLAFLWDYGNGDLATVKRHLARNLDLFERCFLRAEVEGFLELLVPARLEKPHSELALLKRLASFKHFLKESYNEARIGLYDFLLLDLSLGRLVFLLANDLTNNHFAEITPKNLREALAVIIELLNISSIKGLALRETERRQAELAELRDATSRDYPRMKRCLAAIGAEVQRYLQADVIDAMSPHLARALEAYKIPTSRLSAVRTRFFNNFIRRTQIHVLSEFVEKTAEAVRRDLERQEFERRLHRAVGPVGEESTPRKPEAFIATTWTKTPSYTRRWLGGKGNGIVDMAELGLAVPPAFILGYGLFQDHAKAWLPSGKFESVVRLNLDMLEDQCGRKLGDPEHPLLVSIRSGAPASLPGVMATILNAGMTAAVRASIASRHDRELADSLYRRFLENTLAAMELSAGEDSGSESPTRTPSVQELEERIRASLGDEFLTDPWRQLLRCIELVRASSRSRAVKAYTDAFAYDVATDTAVTVQRMVFGNRGENSLSGVVLTRNPINGDDTIFGEFVRNAQGDEVVMGSEKSEPSGLLPREVLAELERAKRLLSAIYLQDIDFEFTVEEGKLYFLQARAARLSAFAQLKADTDFLKSGLINLAEFRSRLERLQMVHPGVALPRTDFGIRTWSPPLAVGVPINGGVVSGTLVLTRERLSEAAARREAVVYFGHTTKPTDFDIMNGSQAIVTIYPGRTSHAAITTMAMNKPCIVGCANAHIDYENRRVIFGSGKGETVSEGERITADGNTGAIYRGLAPVSEFFLPLEEIEKAIVPCRTGDQAAEAVQRLLALRLAGLSRETTLKRRGVSDARIPAGARVLLRVDANIPSSSPPLVRRRRLEQVAPTLRLLLEMGATPIICSHLGDPGATPDAGRSREETYGEYSLESFGRELEGILGERITFHPVSVGASGLLVGKEHLAQGRIHLLENLRFAAGEKDNDEGFARSLAELSDGWYINDAFNVSSRRHASMTGVPRFVEHRIAGLAVEGELRALAALIEHPARPFAAVFSETDGGAQSGVRSVLSYRADKILCRGELAPGDLQAAGTILWIGSGAFVKDAEGAWGAGGETPGALEPRLRAAHEAGAFIVVCSEEDKHWAGNEDDSSGFHVSAGPRAFLEFLERLSLPGITALESFES